jgi:hydrogenase maturation factor
MRWRCVSNQIKVEKHFHKYNINHIYKNMNKTTSKTAVKTVTASTKTAKPASKPAAPAKPTGGKKK